MLFPHVLLAVLFICQGSAYCFHQFPCTFSKMVPHLAMGSTKPSQILGAAQIHREGEEHLKGLREVENKIPGSLEARKSPKITFLDAVSCSTPIQGISALCWATVRLPKTAKLKSFPLLPLQGNGVWLWGRRRGQWQKEARKLNLPPAGHSSVI